MNFQSKVENTLFIINKLNDVAKEHKRIKKFIIISSLLILTTIGLNIFAPLAFRVLISHLSFNQHAALYEGIILAAIYSILWSLRQVTVQLREIFCFPIIEKLLFSFIQSFFQKLQLLSITEYSKIQAGKTIDTISRAQENFPDLFLGLFLYAIPTIIEIFLIVAIFIFYFKLIFSAIFIAFISLYLFVTVWGTIKFSLFQKKYINKRNIFQSYLTDKLLNFEIIKNFNKEQYENEQCAKHLLEYEHSKIKSDIFLESLRLGQGLILGFLITLLTLIGTYYIKKQQLTIQDLILINFYFIQIMNPLSFLGMALKDIKKGLINMDEIIKFLKKEQTTHLDSGKTSFIKIPSKSCIETKDVGFIYDDKIILEGISFKLNHSGIIGLTGETGSGKSTIAKLLTRFLDPTFGSIYLAEKNIGNISLPILRKLIGYVSQSEHFFNDSIYNNLVYGNIHTSFKEVEKAVEMTCLQDVIKSLPEGYNTQIGKNGIALSGGQLQRLALARVLLIKPRFYILDEVTSALDVNIQDYINTAIKSLSKYSSFLVISHRLSHIQYADEIIVLSEGKNIEKGDHFSLLNSKGMYSKFWHQSKGE